MTRLGTFYESIILIGFPSYRTSGRQGRDRLLKRSKIHRLNKLVSGRQPTSENFRSRGIECSRAPIAASVLTTWLSEAKIPFAVALKQPSFYKVGVNSSKVRTNKKRVDTAFVDGIYFDLRPPTSDLRPPTSDLRPPFTSAPAHRTAACTVLPVPVFGRRSPWQRPVRRRGW